MPAIRNRHLLAKLCALSLEQASAMPNEFCGIHHPVTRLGREAIQLGEPFFAAQQVVVEDQGIHVAG